MDKEMERAIRSVLETTPGVVLGYAFGSRGRGDAREASDLDIAVLFDEPPTIDGEAGLARRLQEAVGPPRIDLAILNRATPLLAFEVIREGRLLHRRSVRDENRFETRAIREWYDTAPLREIHHRYLREWALGAEA